METLHYDNEVENVTGQFMSCTPVCNDHVSQGVHHLVPINMVLEDLDQLILCHHTWHHPTCPEEWEALLDMVSV